MKTSQTRSFLIGSLSLAVIADGVAAEADNPVFGRLRRRHKIKNKSFSSPVPRFGVDSAPVCRLGLHLEPYPGRRPESPGNFTTPDSIGKSLTGTPSRSLCNSLIENQPETLIQKKQKKKHLSLIQEKMMVQIRNEFPLENALARVKWLKFPSWSSVSKEIRLKG